MLLPIPSNRALMRSFWSLFSVITGVSAALLGSAVAAWDVNTSLAFAVAGAVVIAIPGLVFPYAVALPYRGWNWGVRRFSRLAVRYVTAVCFWTVGLACARSGKPKRFEPSVVGRSSWRRRGTLPDAAYASQYNEQLPGTSGFRSVQAWTRVSGPRLAWTLIPFLVLIRFLDTGTMEPDESSGNIYTLY